MVRKRDLVATDDNDRLRHHRAAQPSIRCHLCHVVLHRIEDVEADGVQSLLSIIAATMNRETSMRTSRASHPPSKAQQNKVARERQAWTGNVNCAGVERARGSIVSDHRLPRDADRHMADAHALV